MHKKLDDYLEEISHYLTDASEREEILSELRSHVLERAEQEGGTDVAFEKAIAALGRPRQVAERYSEDKPIIAPALRRYLFRYASLLFAVHLAFIVYAVAFKSSFVIFPFFYMPRLGILDAVMYLPMAFLADFGLVALVLYFVTRSNREVRLPWPKLALELDGVQARTVGRTAANLVGGVILLAIAWLLLTLMQPHGAFFLLRLPAGEFEPLLRPLPGRLLSWIVIALLAAGALERFVKAFARSNRLRCRVTAASDAFVLLLIAAALGVMGPGMFAAAVPARLHAWLYKSLNWFLLVTALIVAFDLVANLVRLGRSRLDKEKKTSDDRHWQEEFLGVRRRALGIGQQPRTIHRDE